MKKYYEMIEGGGGYVDPYETIRILNKIIEVKEKERKEWADMCIRKQARIEELEALINNPELNNFIEAIKTEAAHQLERWGVENEETNPPHHYILVFAKLLGKLSVDIFDRNTDKFKHHCITIAAEMHNLHRQIDKENTVVHKFFYKQIEQ